MDLAGVWARPCRSRDWPAGQPGRPQEEARGVPRRLWHGQALGRMGTPPPQLMLCSTLHHRGFRVEGGMATRCCSGAPHGCVWRGSGEPRGQVHVANGLFRASSLLHTAHFAKSPASVRVHRTRGWWTPRPPSVRAAQGRCRVAKVAHRGSRTHSLQIRSLARYPIAPGGPSDQNTGDARSISLKHKLINLSELILLGRFFAVSASGRRGCRLPLSGRMPLAFLALLPTSASRCALGA